MQASHAEGLPEMRVQGIEPFVKDDIEQIDWGPLVKHDGLGWIENLL